MGRPLGFSLIADEGKVGLARRDLARIPGCTAPNRFTLRAGGFPQVFLAFSPGAETKGTHDRKCQQ